MHGWAQFYATIAAVAATLMGLLFVAVSVSAVEAVGVGPGASQRLSGQALQNYLTTVMIALIALIPDISTRSFGLASLCLISLGASLTVVRLVMFLFKADDKDRRLNSIRRYGASILGFAMLIFSAVRMSLGDGDHRTMFAVSLLVLLGSATMVSWELLLRIGQIKDGDPS